MFWPVASLTALHWPYRFSRSPFHWRIGIDAPVAAPAFTILIAGTKLLPPASDAAVASSQRFAKRLGSRLPSPIPATEMYD